MRDEDRFRRKNEKRFPFVLTKIGKFGPNIPEGPFPVFGLIDKETLDNNRRNDKNTQIPTSQERQGEKGGRPRGDRTKQEKKAGPRNSPIGQKTSASLSVGDVSIDPNKFEVGCQIFNKIYRILSKSLVKKRNLESIKNLSSNDKQIVCDIIDDIIIYFNSVSDVKKNKIESLLKNKVNNSDDDDFNKTTAPPKLDRCVKDVSKRMIDKFKNNKGRSPNKKERQEITSSAFAICTKTLKKSGDI